MESSGAGSGEKEQACTEAEAERTPPHPPRFRPNQSGFPSMLKRAPNALKTPYKQGIQQLPSPQRAPGESESLSSSPPQIPLAKIEFDDSHPLKLAPLEAVRSTPRQIGAHAPLGRLSSCVGGGALYDPFGYSSGEGGGERGEVFVLG